MVALNGYTYKTEDAFDVNGKALIMTETDKMKSVLQLEEFLSDIKEYNEKDISTLVSERKKHSCISDELASKLYDVYFDMVYFGAKSNEWFLEAFCITQNELNKILT